MLQIIPSKFAFYKKTSNEISISIIRGMLGEKPGTIYRNNGINDFEITPTVIPDGYEPIKAPSDEWIKKYFYNPNLKWVEPFKVPEYNQKYYYIHDNGGRPFIVYLSNNTATIYRIPNQDENSYVKGKISRQLYHKKVWQGKYQQAFIGKSPNYYIKVDGNNILLHINGLKYIHIGEVIEEFTALSPIVYYESSVGNNDVPYPYAKDDQNRYYMMLDNVIMSNYKNNKYPYTEYYDREHILSHDCINFKDKSWKNYIGYYVNDEPWCLNWSSKPVEYYDRALKNGEMYLLTKDGNKQPLTRKLYIEFIEQYGQENGLIPFPTKVIHKRIW